MQHWWPPSGTFHRMSGDWFRNTTWNAEIERAFMEKLERARSQRDQYLAIQTLTIAPHDSDIALRLAELFFETRKDAFQDVRVLDAIAAAHLTRGDLQACLGAYKRAISRKRSDGSAAWPSQGLLEFPYLVAVHRVRDEYDATLAFLDQTDDGGIFPAKRFKVSATKAMLSADMGRRDEAKTHAKRALANAKLKNSGLPNHPTLGLVGLGHVRLKWRLRRIAYL